MVVPYVHTNDVCALFVAPPLVICAPPRRISSSHRRKKTRAKGILRADCFHRMAKFIYMFTSPTPRTQFANFRGTTTRSATVRIDAECVTTLLFTSLLRFPRSQMQQYPAWIIQLFPRKPWAAMFKSTVRGHGQDHLLMGT